MDPRFSTAQNATPGHQSQANIVNLNQQPLALPQPYPPKFVFKLVPCPDENSLDPPQDPNTVSNLVLIVQDLHTRNANLLLSNNRLQVEKNNLLLSNADWQERFNVQDGMIDDLLKKIEALEKENAAMQESFQRETVHKMACLGRIRELEQHLAARRLPSFHPYQR